MVIGPTPPGTGEISEAFLRTPFEIHITHQPAIRQAIDAHIDHDHTGLDHLRDDETGHAGRHHQDVGQHRELSQILGLLVADADRGVLLHQHQGHGFADDVAGTHHDHILPRDGDLLVFEQLLHAKRRAGWKNRIACYQATDVVEMETIDVLLHRDAFEHMRHFDVRRATAAAPGCRAPSDRH